MSENKVSYRQIMKSTSIFGGVQVFNILIAIIRSKFVAVLLGPAGMGIMGLLTTTLSMVGAATNFGLSTSAVRDIAEAHNTQNHEKIKETISIFRKLIWLTGILGMGLTIVLSPFLSKLTFGNYNYTLAFIALSITLLIGQLAAGQIVLLQGLRKIKWLAKAGLFASLLGLITSLPLYYFFGQDGIVPALIVTAIFLFFINYYFANKIDVDSEFISIKAALKKGKGMLKLGFMLSLSGMITAFCSYIIRIFIANDGGVEDVGLYNAGFTLISVYIGMVFTAMATDYYPRLAGANKNTETSNSIINQQSEIALLILAPLICTFLIFINCIIILLYSTKFLPISEMVHWAMLGVYFKSVSWAIGYLILAKGDSKFFFWNELISSAYLLMFNVIGYKIAGLTGLGVSFLLGYILHFFQMLYVSTKFYHFRLEKSLLKIFLVSITFGVICFIVATNLQGLLMYTIGSCNIIGVIFFSFHFLNKKLNLVELFNSKFKK